MFITHVYLVTQTIYGILCDKKDIESADKLKSETYLGYINLTNKKFFYISGQMQPDGCKLSVLLTFSHVEEK